MNQDLEKLVRDSQRLAQTGYQDFPQLNRSLSQVERLSQNLKRQTRDESFGSDLPQYNRIMAAGGIDGNRLESDTQSLKIQLVMEDIQPKKGIKLGEYVQHVSEYHFSRTLVDVQQLKQERFAEGMIRHMNREWNKRPRLAMDPDIPLVHGTDSPLRSHSISLRGSLSPAIPSTALDRSLTPGGGTTSALNSTPIPLSNTSYPQTPQIAAEEKALGKAVGELMGAKLRGGQFDAAEVFLEALQQAEDEAGSSKQLTQSKKCWNILKFQIAEQNNMGAGRSALLRGSRRHLEVLHAEYIKDRVQKYPTIAQRKGDLSKIMLANAFLRVKYQDTMPQNITYIVLYFCIRSGWYDDAVQEFSNECTNDVIQGIRALQSGEQIAPELSVRLKREASRCLSELNAHRNEQPLNDKYRALVYTVLSRDGQIAQQFMQNQQKLVDSIDDHMWFKLSVTSFDQQAQSSWTASQLTSPVSNGVGVNRGGGWYKLNDLHDELNRWDYKYYSQNGRDPYQYVMVLFWSLQYRTALAFLMSGEGGGNRLDAVHYGIALYFHNMLESGSFSDTGFLGQSVNVVALIQEYGKRIKERKYYNCNEFSLSYYMLAADVYCADSTDKEKHLEKQSDMLYEFVASGNNADGYLFGGAVGESLLSYGSSNNPLSKYIQDVDERRQVLEQVANVFERNSKYQQAVMVYLAADDPASALQIINQLISGRLQIIFEQEINPSKDQELNSLIVQGSSAQNTLISGGKHGSSSSQHIGANSQIETFGVLQSVVNLLECYVGKESSKAYAAIKQIPFIPLGSHHFLQSQCVSMVQSLPLALSDRLGMIFIMVAEVLQKEGLMQELRVVSNFANSIGTKLRQSVLARISVLASR